MKYLYRGVHAEHPALRDAKAGVVRPANPEGHVTPYEHNFGWVSADSPFTSWTHDKQRAIWFRDRRGPGGVLLHVPVGTPDPGEYWSWVYSENLWDEDEVLMLGVRLNVEVIE